MPAAARLFRQRMQDLGLDQKALAARWHSVALERGCRLQFHTVISELSRFLAGRARGFRFFFARGRFAITARALACPEAVILSRALEVCSEPEQKSLRLCRSTPHLRAGQWPASFERSQFLLMLSPAGGES